jgi:hypothetical protein
MCVYLNDPAITTIDVPRVPITVHNMTSVNIRFATFAVQFPNDQDAGRIMLLDTIPLPGFYNMNLRTLVDRGVIGENDPMITLFIRKILSEHRTERITGRYVVSMDVYYNRSIAESGKWHRDSHPGEMTHHASLEYFVPLGEYFLGPEVLYYPQQPGEVLGPPISDRRIEAHLQALRQHGAEHLTTSLRYIGTDGSVFMFDNVEAVHATPMTQPKPVSTEGDPNYDIFHGSRNQTRTLVTLAEGVADLEEINRVTREMQRSFIRSWLRSIVVMPVGGRELLTHVHIFLPQIAHEYDSTVDSMNLALRNAVGGNRLVNFRVQAPFIANMNTGEDIPKQRVADHVKNEASQLKNFIQLVRKQKRIKGGKKTRRKKSKRNTRRKTDIFYRI